MNVNQYGSASSSQVNDDRVYNDSRGRPVGLATQIFKVENGQVRMRKPNAIEAPTFTPQDKREGKTTLVVDETRL